jgi:hypothetical protein
MAYKVEGIKSQDELEKAQASANAEGTTVANYAEWSKIMKELEESGVKSTGSFSGDKAKLQEVESTVKEYIAKIQEEQAVQQQQEPEKVEASAKTDREQQIKATVANATSSVIMADYMKYYHLLG